MIAILNTNAGNIASVANALDRLGQSYFVADNAAALSRADKIIFPGVGAAKAAMREIRERGFDTVLKRTDKPVFAICLGLQLLADFSEEGDAECLGIIPGRVKRFKTDLPVPQTGWNRLQIDRPAPRIFDGAPNRSFFYFTNSYYLPVGPFSIATSLYGVYFSAAIRKNNFYATQFHPEKSGEAGLQLLRNFCESC